MLTVPLIKQSTPRRSMRWRRDVQPESPAVATFVLYLIGIYHLKVRDSIEHHWSPKLPLPVKLWLNEATGHSITAQ